MNFFPNPTTPCPPKLDINEPSKLNNPIIITNPEGKAQAFTHHGNNVFGNEQSLKAFNVRQNEILTKSPATHAAISNQFNGTNVATFAVGHESVLQHGEGGKWFQPYPPQQDLRQYKNHIIVNVECENGAVYTAHEFVHELQSTFSADAFHEIVLAWEEDGQANHGNTSEEYQNIFGYPLMYLKEYQNNRNPTTWGRFRQEIGAYLMSAKLKYGQKAIDKYAPKLAKVLDRHLGKKIFTESNLEIALQKCKLIYRKIHNKQEKQGGGPPDKGNFKQLIQQKRLVESYRASNPLNPIQKKKEEGGGGGGDDKNVPEGGGDSGGDIGGVACSTEYIEGLFDTPEAIFEQDHYFCMPAQSDGQIPFSDEELRQILRELSIGIYAHSTVPFFSLHFNQNADLVPIIHPVYKNTLVGRVISMLDYIMKGYLNGGVFQEEFVDEFYKNSNWDVASTSALRQMIDFTEHCETHLEGEDKEYVSLRVMLQKIKSQSSLETIGLGDELIDEKSAHEAKILSDFSGFSNSFRIIAKQNSIQKEGNLFLLDSDFEVLYTINPSPEYKEALEQYTRKHGRAPASYESMLRAYDEMCKLIHDHMVKMPICRRYFSMLSVINFFSGYFSTLKKHRKIPILPVLETQNVKGSPDLFPHLPLQAIGNEHLKYNSHQVMKALVTKTTFPIHSWSDLQPDEKASLLGQCKTEIYENILNLCSAPFRRSILNSPKLIEEIKEVIEKFAQQYLDNFIRLYKSQTVNYIGSNFSNALFDAGKSILNILIYGETSEVKFFKAINNESEDLLTTPLEFITTFVKSESTLEEIQLGKRIVGGCGMRLSRQVARSSEKTASILQQHWAELLSLKYESFYVLKFKATDKDKKAVFRLGFKEIPSWADDDYNWMESLLVDSEINDSELIRNRLAIINAMNSDCKSEFINLADNFNSEQLSRIKDRYQRTLLHDAACLSNPFYMESLLNKGLSQNAEDIYGYKPIHYAAKSGALTQLESLLSENMNSKSYDNSTPLIVAIQNNKLEVVARLLKGGALFCTTSVGFNPLHCALHQRNLKIINLLLDHTQPFSEWLNELAEEEGTPLMLACELNSKELIERLINMGANRSITRKDGMTAIEIAIKRNAKTMLLSLLDHGNALDKPTLPSNQAIGEAVKSSHLEIVKLLMRDYQSFYSYRNSFNDTALHTAIRHGNLSVALAIIEDDRTDITYLEKQNDASETAFDFAASLGLWNVLAKLCAKGVQKNILKTLKAGYHPLLEEIFKTTSFSRDELNQALLIAAKAGNHEVITRLLIPKGANIDHFQDSKGWGILHYLATCNGLFLFKKLIAKTRNLLNPLQQDGNKTLPYLAAEYRSGNILRFLLEQMEKQKIPLSGHYRDRHLFYAVVEAGDIKQVRMMLEIFKNEPLANHVLDDMDTRPVHLAAKIGSHKLLKLLSNYQVNLNVEDKYGFTSLDYAVRNESIKTILFLLEGDEKVLVTGKALSIAASQDDEKILRLLAKHKPSEGAVTDALMQVIMTNDVKAFLNLLWICDASLECMNSTGWTPLMLASAHGRYEIVSKILERVPLDKRTVNGDNALHLASKGGHAHCVQLLVASGFDRFENNDKGINSFDFAASESVVAILENKLNYFEQIQVFKNAITNKDYTVLKSTIEKLPLNETIKIFKDNKLICGTPLQILLCFDKSRNAVSVVIKFLKTNRINLDLLDSDGNSLAHHLVMAKIYIDDSISTLSLNASIGLKDTSLFMPSQGIVMANYKGETILHQAAKYMDLQTIEMLINGVNIDVVDLHGRTPLFYAIENKKTKNIEFLIRRGANLRHRDYKLCTALIFACANKMLHIVNILLQNGADPNQHGTAEKILPLHFSLALGNDEMVRSLLLHGVDCNLVSSKGIHAVHIAAEKGKMEFLRLFAGKGISLEVKDAQGVQPIHKAAAQGKTKTVAALLPLQDFAIGMGVNGQDAEKEKFTRPLDSALLYAASGSQQDTMQYLLRLHSNPETKDVHGLDTLALTAMNSPISTLEPLLTYKLSRNTDSLCSAIKMAITKDNVDAMIALYQQGVTPNLNLEEGVTGLHIASERGALQCTRWLLQNGADHLHPSFSGKNALEISASNSSFEQFNLLLDYTSADVNFANNRGETLLHIAARKGNLSHVMGLIRKEASIETTDSAGRTPLHIAAKEGKTDVVKMLLICGASFLIKTTDGRTPQRMVADGDLETRVAFEKYIMCCNNANAGESHLHMAIRSQNLLALAFVSTLVDVDQQDSLGIAPLHLAIQTGQMKFMQALIRAGARIDIVDQLGRTPLWYANELHNEEIVNGLIHAGAEG